MKKEPTRQYLSQVKRMKAGLCRICARPLANGTKHYCQIHWESTKTANRNYYRKAHGIPMSRPVRKYVKSDGS